MAKPVAVPAAPPKVASSGLSKLVHTQAEPPIFVDANQLYILRMLNQGLDVPVSGIGIGQYFDVSGVFNVNASYWSKPYFGQGTRDTTATTYLDLATANLNLNGHFGQWVSMHVGGLYMNGHSPTVMNYRPANQANHQVALEDAYVTIANFQAAPFYLQGGQMFLPFGEYKRYPITQTLAQILSQTDLPTAQVGYISSWGGFASLYTASGEKEFEHNSTGLNTYGATLGYQNFTGNTDYDVGVSYLNNMAQVDAIREIADNNHGYNKSVPGIAAYGDLYAGPFGFGARYVTATSRFNTLDYAYDDYAESTGAKPYAADFDASFKFNTRGHRSLFDVFYQFTGNAFNMSPTINGNNVTRLPKYRIGGDYGVNLIKDLAFNLQYYQDKNYPSKNGGNSKWDNVLIGQLSFAF